MKMSCSADYAPQLRARGFRMTPQRLAILHVLRHERPNATALMYLSERAPLTNLSWEDFAGKVRILATQLRKLGVKPGELKLDIYRAQNRGIFNIIQEWAAELLLSKESAGLKLADWVKVR